jgi:hypothetical protein
MDDPQRVALPELVLGVLRCDRDAEPSLSHRERKGESADALR